MAPNGVIALSSHVSSRAAALEQQVCSRPRPHVARVRTRNPRPGERPAAAAAAARLPSHACPRALALTRLPSHEVVRRDAGGVTPRGRSSPPCYSSRPGYLSWRPSPSSMDKRPVPSCHTGSHGAIASACGLPAGAGVLVLPLARPPRGQALHLFSRGTLRGLASLIHQSHAQPFSEPWGLARSY
jgi:hypothetical protein